MNGRKEIFTTFLNEEGKGCERGYFEDEEKEMRLVSEWNNFYPHVLSEV